MRTSLPEGLKAKEGRLQVNIFNYMYRGNLRQYEV